jgi:hypothetical protein
MMVHSVQDMVDVGISYCHIVILEITNEVLHSYRRWQWPEPVKNNN